MISNVNNLKKSRIHKSRSTGKWIVWIRKGGENLWGYGHPSWYEGLAYLCKVLQGWPNRPEDILARQEKIHAS
jgi:hypothetical protein